MLIDQLSSQLCRSKPMKTLLSKLDAGEDALFSVGQSARPLVVASLYSRNPRPTIVVVSGEDASKRFANALSAYLGSELVVHLPQREDLFWQDKTPDAMVVGQRCRAIHMLNKGERVIIVASARALLRMVPPRESDVFEPVILSYGGTFPFAELAQTLTRKGYVRLDEMEGRGTFSLRGDTLEIYPGNSVYPVRAEFFGDEIDGLRRIVPATGQSIGNLAEIAIYPCRELTISARGAARVRQHFAGGAKNPFPMSKEELDFCIERLGQGISFDGVEMFLPYLYSTVETPFAHISSDALVVLAEPRALFDDATRLYEEIEGAAKAAKQTMGGYYAKPAALDFGEQQRLTLLSMMRVGQSADAELVVKRPQVGGTEERFMSGLRSLVGGSYTVVLSIPDRRARESIKLSLSDARLPIVEVLDERDAKKVQDESGNTVLVNEDGEIIVKQAARMLKAGVVNVVDTDIPSGLIIPEAHLGIVSLADTGGRKTQRSSRKQVDPTTLTFSYKPGDYVVHSMHGIALFKEILRQEVAGVERDYLLLEYAHGDKLYVPVEQVDRITRYVGPEGASPRLTRLNTSDWSRAIGRARNSAKKLAFDLVDLYARRSTVKGYKYSSDTTWQREMEESFPFTETPDQLFAIADVKADMESDKPMDRLVCGDVGFGKTEVVLRAAFKAVQDNRQVMVLCPTTILAQQHFTTFSERFEPFDVKVEVLSRFRTNKQQEAALEGFSAGTVDVLIGTHRLLSRDVNPKDLGLIIIDEEQRFGVQHKEQLKNLREQVDVITLSATPIPRTMQMALSGVRDMSLIETPPPERMPVQVRVGEWDEDVVSAAIRNEMQRGGQVYYVSNRVRTIEDAIQRVRDAAPEARIGVAHGKLKEHQLEAVMEAFAAREIDVLVATTIIESGIDNPHTNTLIIEDSQRLGLAQLYQLKGRVGRSRSQAYAYFLFPSASTLTETATDRLTAISELQELGSGTKIAMRDLEIRGAGNLLGAEQSGNMSAVGFDLFAQMLSEAVGAARGEEQIAHPEIKVDLPAHFYLPEEYMPAADERVLYYRRIAAAAYPEVLDTIADTMRSAYGALPEPAANLFDRAKIKAYAAALGVKSVVLVGGKIAIQPIDLGKQGYVHAVRAGGVYIEKKQKLIMPVSRGESSVAVASDLMEVLAKKADEEIDGEE
ncbi:MAG: transcription-repair coupling factor [Actinobacteria bacterium]|nr:transcription-repair coupling factor [Actinomycetota bacterium]